MGCDIHLHVEFKVTGMWHHYGHPDICRDYDLFAKMANVRSKEGFIPISDPKGLPKDASFTTKYSAKQYGTEAHSYSYLMSEEIKELSIWALKEQEWPVDGFEKTFGYFFGWDFYNKEYWPKDVEDVRFVFWFDN